MKKFLPCLFLLTLATLASPAHAKTITLSRGESLRASELRGNDTVSCGMAAPAPKADACKPHHQTLMKEIGNCAVCMSSVEGNSYYWLRINGADTGTQYSSVDGALRDMNQAGYRGLCQ